MEKNEKGFPLGGNSLRPKRQSVSGCVCARGHKDRMYVCVCVCVCEAKKTECVCVCVCVCTHARTYARIIGKAVRRPA